MRLAAHQAVLPLVLVRQYALGDEISQFASANRHRFEQCWNFAGKAGRTTPPILWNEWLRSRSRLLLRLSPKETSQDIGRIRRINAIASPKLSTIECHSKQPPLILEQDGVVTRQRLENGHVRCREFETAGASGGRSFEMDALHAAAEAEFGRSLPRLEAELRVGGVPDLDAIETSTRERALDLGAKTCADLLEARDAADPRRRSGRALGRSGSSGPTSVAATAAAASTNWTARWVWRAGRSRPARRASTRMPPVPTAMKRRAAS